MGPDGTPLSGQISKESLIREAKENKPFPFVEGIDSKGLMTIGWSNRLVPLSDYPKIADSTILVQGVPQDSMLESPLDTRRLQSSEKEIKLVPIRESIEEFKNFIRQRIELDALDVTIVNEFGEPRIDIDFSFSVMSYTSDTL